MEKILSIRPTVQIIMLFREIKVLDLHQKSDRSSIVNRALEMAISKKTDWKLVLTQNINSNIMENTPPDFMKLRVEEKKYNVVLEQIKKSFSLKRVTNPYMIKLLLSFYLSELRKEDKKDVINLVEGMVNIGVDCLVFKKEYDFSDYEDKEELYQLSRKYLEECAPILNNNIREQINATIKKYSDYFNIERYLPKPRSDFGTCNIVFVAKVLAGLFLTISEINNYDPKQIVNCLEAEINKYTN